MLTFCYIKFTTHSEYNLIANRSDSTLIITNCGAAYAYSIAKFFLA